LGVISRLELIAKENISS